mmetsp:Transcript_1478/g.3480  ORF Transcript_1478/g.3480 Transcript_1478/m.3480 type:complete len:289 (+) Transcript_1478:2377-3243(+)
MFVRESQGVPELMKRDSHHFATKAKVQSLAPPPMLQAAVLAQVGPAAICHIGSDNDGRRFHTSSSGCLCLHQPDARHLRVQVVSRELESVAGRHRKVGSQAILDAPSNPRLAGEASGVAERGQQPHNSRLFDRGVVWHDDVALRQQEAIASAAALLRPLQAAPLVATIADCGCVLGRQLASREPVKVGDREDGASAEGICEAGRIQHLPDAVKDNRPGLAQNNIVTCLRGKQRRKRFHSSLALGDRLADNLEERSSGIHAPQAVADQPLVLLEVQHACHRRLRHLLPT